MSGGHCPRGLPAREAIATGGTPDGRPLPAGGTLPPDFYENANAPGGAECGRF